MSKAGVWPYFLDNWRKKCCKLRKMWYTILNQIKGQGVRANSPQAEWGAMPRESVTVMPVGADASQISQIR